ncbi:MAG: DUF2062 domain-containing protein [Mangrovicoccus sp.]|nr:DUF2062 domain-containing protein [Mangrovicoccus sp.]
MVFKRKQKRSYLQVAQESVYPKGGWGRAASYIGHRLRRLPDPPQRIARGIAAGVFITFTPFFGLHFLLGAALALLVRGNVFAAMLATFVGNPITFPLIATLSLRIGNTLLHRGTEALPRISPLEAFSQAFGELWWNLASIWRDTQPHWEQLAGFFKTVFLPYLVGGVIPGLIGAFLAYALSKPLIEAYQRRRAQALKRPL